MNVLFVEDNPMNRVIVRNMLEVGGCEMSEAEDAVLGLKMIEAADYDIILMDLRMPGMDGLTSIREIRARSDGKANIPIVVVTADASPGLFDICIQSGADGLVMKPIGMQSLFDAIADALLKRSPDDEAEGI